VGKMSNRIFVSLMVSRSKMENANHPVFCISRLWISLYTLFSS
jgi:hypothetical protein